VAKAQKHLEKAYSGLGAVVYGMLREGSEAIKDDPAVATQMKNVQEAEEMVKEVDEQIQAIHDEFAAKRQELKEKYQAKRTAADQAPAEDAEG
jgi:protein-arginine kinase